MTPNDFNQYQGNYNMNEMPQQGEEFISEEELMQPQEKKNNTWQYVAIGGTAALLLGVGGAYAATHMGDDKPEAPEPEDLSDAFADTAGATVHHDHHHHTTFHSRMHSTLMGDMRIAEVSDSLSFDDAFAAARAQVGPGGIFEWRGGIYGTYYANEWNAMSDEEREIFAMRTSETDIYGGDADPATTRVGDDGNIVAVKDDGSYEYLGEVETRYSDGSSERIAYGRIAGQDISYFDVDGDGATDYMAIDRNQNGRWDDGEVRDMRTQSTMRGVTSDNISEEIRIDHGDATVVSMIATDADGTQHDYLADNGMGTSTGMDDGSVIAANNVITEGTEGNDPDYNNNLDILVAEKGEDSMLAYTSDGSAPADSGADYMVDADSGSDYMVDADSGVDYSADSGSETDYMADAGSEASTDSYDAGYTEPPVEDPAPTMDTAMDTSMDSGADYSGVDAGMDMV